MFTSSMGGMGGSSQIDTMVYRILEAEQEPLFKMHDRTVELDEKVEAYQDINTKMDTFKKEANKITAATFRPTASSSNENIVTAQASGDIVATSYDIEVEQLAQTQRLVSTRANRTDAWKDGGSFYLRTENDLGFKVDLEVKEGEELSLRDIARAINNANDNDGLVQAVVIDDNLMIEVMDSNTNLVVEDGDGVLKSLGILKDGDTEFDLDTTGGDQNYLLDLTDESEDRLLRKSQEAKFKINGLEVRTDTNQVEGVVEGITFNLNGVTPEGEEPTKIDLGVDAEKIKEAIESFVESYNEVVESFKFYGDSRRTKEVEDEEDGSKETVRGGALQGESGLRSLESSFSNSVIFPINGIGGEDSAMTLSQFGIEVQRDGTLEIKESRAWGQTLDEAIENNLDELRELFTREETMTIRANDLEFGDNFNEFSLTIDGEQKTLTSEEGFQDLDELIEAIGDNDDFRRLIARKNEDGDMRLISFRNISHEDEDLIKRESAGIIGRIEQTINSATDRHRGYIGQSGGRQGRIPALERDIDRINDDIERGLDRLELREQQLRQEFARMEQIVAGMQSQMQSIFSFGF
ncbi:flagellar filament capping protein FliD [Halonatronum saccharophilum]|uniref:flagellar filament capping protein FliD n=1 Tax=Halonatronum saccharophilum TaxID=150060 RepID=UPI0004818B84|nr:flagellar filament capping protein FliD [Halonatronum saccharophilum]